MAQGYLQHFGGEGMEVLSAGIEAHGVNPRAITVMQEDGIDIAHHTSNLVDEYADIAFDHVITVCDNAREACPFFPARVRQHHQDFADPAKASGTEQEIMDAFRDTRDAIKRYCERFIADLVANAR